MSARKPSGFWGIPNLFVESAFDRAATCRSWSSVTRLAARLGALLALWTGPLAAQGNLVGIWRGYWARAGDTVVITMHIAPDSTGVLRGSFDSDRLRVLGIPVTDIALRGADVRFRIPADFVTSEYQGTLVGDSLAGMFREGNTTGTFAFRRAAASGPRWREVELKVPNGSVTLAGSLILPEGVARAPVVVFMHGAGGEGRWASRLLAVRLAERGVGGFIWDKRGVGGSSGDWRAASFDDQAGDVAAIVAALAADSRVDAARIGIHGHSQGGTISPIAAVRAPRVAFVVGSAAAAGPLDSVEVFSVLNYVLPRAATAADSADARAFVAEVVAVGWHGRPRARLDSLAAAWQGRTWMFELPPPDNFYWAFSRRAAGYDPLQYWARVRVPVLLVYGEDDAHVPARASAGRITAVLAARGNTDVTVRIFPGADHTYRLPPGSGGWPRTVDGYPAAVVDWITARVAR